MKTKIKLTFSFFLVLLLSMQISCKSESSDNPAAPAVTYQLRDIGPGGGYIFYINPNAATDGWTYLEAAPTDQSTGVQWGGYGTPVSGTGTAIGTGKNNTTLILAKLGTLSETGRAAQLCNAYTSNGTTGWFLPSKDELYQMCWILHSRRRNGSVTENNPVYGTNRVGGFVNDSYWTSSEDNGNEAWCQTFLDGFQFANPKSDSTVRVRPVRAF